MKALSVEKIGSLNWFIIASCFQQKLWWHRFSCEDRRLTAYTLQTCTISARPAEATFVAGALGNSTLRPCWVWASVERERT